MFILESYSPHNDLFISSDNEEHPVIQICLLLFKHCLGYKILKLEYFYLCNVIFSRAVSGMKHIELGLESYVHKSYLSMRHLFVGTIDPYNHLVCIYADFISSFLDPCYVLQYCGRRMCDLSSALWGYY